MRLPTEQGFGGLEIENLKFQIRCVKLNGLESFLHFNPATLKTVIEH